MLLKIINALKFVFDIDLNDRSACQACEEVLYAYIDAKLDGEDAGAKFPHVKIHLEGCVLCQRSYDELEALLLMERESQMTPPKPEPDFLDLKPTALKVPKIPLWQKAVSQINQHVVHLSGELRILIRQGVATFDKLPIERQSLALAHRSTDEQVPLAILPDKEANIEISVAVAALSDSRLSLTVRVETLKPSRPMRRVKVTLNDLQGMMLQAAYTKANGQVEFPKIDLGNYLLIVKHKKRKWQLPITR